LKDDTGKSDFERTYSKNEKVMKHWEPDIADPGLRTKISRVATNMSYLLRLHVLEKWPEAAILLLSHDRSRYVSDPNSFWNNLENFQATILEVARTHQSVFADDRYNVFAAINGLIEKMD